MARAFSLGGLPNSGLAFTAPHPPRRYCASHPYIVRHLKIAPQPRDFRQAVRYARRGYASLPTSRDPVCEHHLVSCRIGITPESTRQEKSEMTYVPINNGSSGSRLCENASHEVILGL